MPRMVTLTETEVQKVEIAQAGGVVQVTIFYRLKDDNGDPWANKIEERFSADSGLPAERLMPAAWETAFRNLLGDLKTKLDQFEQLT